MRDTFERLRDIQEAIERINKYTAGGRSLFDENELVQAWVVHHLEIIGEAARSVPQDFRNNYPKIPWKQISRMRNVLIHVYFDIDQEIIWDIVENDLPSLKQNIEAVLRSTSMQDTEEGENAD